MSNPVDEISKIIKAASRDAYARGWQDALDAVAKAAQSVNPPPDSDSVAKPSIAATPRGNGRPASKAVYIVEDCIIQSPGKKGVEVIQAAQLIDPTINERTARTSLRRLKLKKKIWQRNGLWYPKPRHRPENENEEAISSPPHH
jgi:hypothetical protein